MVEYNTVNAKMPDLQLNRIKRVAKNKQGTTLRKVLKCLIQTIFVMNCY